MRRLLLCCALCALTFPFPHAAAAGEIGGPDWLLGRWNELAAGTGPAAPVAGAATTPHRTVYRFDLGAELRLRTGRAAGPFDEEIPFAPRTLRDEALRWRVACDQTVRHGEHWILHHRTRIDSDPTRDPAFRTKEYRQIDAAIAVPQATVEYRTGRIRFWLGRQPLDWGPGWTGSLLLSMRAAPADGCGASFRGRRWRARALLGRIDDHPATPAPLARYLAVHRLELAPHPRLRLALGEAAVVASSNGLPFWLANPLLPWALTQQEDHGPDETVNALWTIDGSWIPVDGWTVYGQFLLDDYMLDEVDRPIYPDQLGWLAGVLWGRPPDPRGESTTWRAGCELSRLQNWTLVHRDPALRYSAWEAPLGHPAGPGSESATAFVCRSSAGASGDLFVWTRWHRRGRIWLGTAENPVGAATIAWPAPPVRRWRQIGCTWRPAPIRGWRANLRAGWVDADGRAASGSVPHDPALADPLRGGWASLGLEIPPWAFGWSE